jgi:hypothetical protein
MTEEPKACPFCGSAEITKFGDDYTELKHKEDCWIVSTGSITDYCVQAFMTPADIAAWNTRKGEK